MLLDHDPNPLDYRFGEPILVNNANSNRKVYMKYNSKVDAGSIGIVLLQCFLGKIPQVGLVRQKQDLEPAIKVEIGKVSDEGLKEVITKTLQVDFRTRKHLFE